MSQDLVVMFVNTVELCKNAITETYYAVVKQSLEMSSDISFSKIRICMVAKNKKPTKKDRRILLQSCKWKTMSLEEMP
ncbi:hypothetical protein HW555_000940 [Spodoptera exigua]|uniref:Uncharacterized protein n=1 Tax=Spodoptera exigua TaxID=7107 RepID=A0A835GU55_SPOEX|nr:hypothetical protein HW555_000940 [Spodoptera exigua]